MNILNWVKLFIVKIFSFYMYWVNNLGFPWNMREIKFLHNLRMWILTEYVFIMNHVHIFVKPMKGSSCLNIWQAQHYLIGSRAHNNQGWTQVRFRGGTAPTQSYKIILIFVNISIIFNKIIIVFQKITLDFLCEDVYLIYFLEY